MWRLKRKENPFKKGDCVFFDDGAFLYESDLHEARKTCGILGYYDKEENKFCWSGAIINDVDPDPENDTVLVDISTTSGVVMRAWVWVDNIKHIRAE